MKTFFGLTATKDVLAAMAPAVVGKKLWGEISKKGLYAATALLASTAMLPLAGAAAQDAGYLEASPMAVRFPSPPESALRHTPTPLAQWNGSFVDQLSNTVTFTMVGTPPSSNTTTHVKVLIIPIKMTYGSSNGGPHTFDPNVDTVIASSATVTANIQASPLFHPTNFAPQGSSCAPLCANLGHRQYLDAFQRGNFWSTAGASYHVKFSPVVVEPEHTITVTPAEGSIIPNPFGGSSMVGTMNLGAFDAKLQTFLSGIAAVHPNVLPVFVTDNIYLTSGGCCVAGYHTTATINSAVQTYAYSTYVVSSTPVFAEDVSQLSAQLANWMDDPFVNNRVNCTAYSFLEVGDPTLAGANAANNYNSYPYALGGFTYNLQSLAYNSYFGAPAADSANSWYAIQDDISAVCPPQ